MRTPKLLALTLLSALALAAEAQAQGARGTRGAGARRGSNLFSGKRKKKKSGAIPNAPLTRAAPTLGGTAPPAGGVAPLAAGEKRFRDLVAEIDKALADSAARLAAAEAGDVPTGLVPPADVEPGTPEWRELQKPVFHAIDFDSSGWLSFREMRDSLDIDRTEYALYDRDHDGRVGSREFMTRYDEVVARTGAYRMPKDRAELGRAQPRTPDQLRSAFDTDSDGGIELEELGPMLAEYGRAGTDPRLLLEKVDADANARIEGPELFQLSRLISYAFVLPPEPAGRKAARPKDALELFGGAEPRPPSPLGASAPPWIPGPTTHFRRLDVDADGFITAEDLRQLQGSATSAARVGAVLAALDADEDGRVSEREFQLSLSTVVRR